MKIRALFLGSTTNFSDNAFLFALGDLDLDLRPSLFLVSLDGEPLEERLDERLEEPELLDDELEPERELEPELLEPELELPLLDFGMVKCTALIVF